MRMLAALALAGCLAGRTTVGAGVPGQATDEIRLLDDSGSFSDPLAPGDDVRVFVFVRRDCPIANRYSPELGRLQDALPRGGGPGSVTFFLAYVDPGDTPELIEAHQREYGLRMRWVVDGQHALARRAGATITPEAAVYSPARDGRRELLYRGRIDDRFIDVGRTRPAATVHDLRDAIAAALEGRRPAPPAGPAIGCFIEDAR